MKNQFYSIHYLAEISTFKLISFSIYLLAILAFPPSLDNCNYICYLTTLASALNKTTWLFYWKQSNPLIKAFTTPVSSPNTSRTFFPTYFTEITFAIIFKPSSPGQIAAILVNLTLSLGFYPSLFYLLGLSQAGFLSPSQNFLYLFYSPYPPLFPLLPLYYLFPLSSLFPLYYLFTLSSLFPLYYLFPLSSLFPLYYLFPLSSLFLLSSLFPLYSLYYRFPLYPLYYRFPLGLFLSILFPKVLSTSYYEILFVEFSFISIYYGVILPNISISREMRFLTQSIMPFLMAMTFPCFKSLTSSPLNNALADPVSSATTHLAMGIFCSQLTTVSTDSILTYTLQGSLRLERSETLIKIGLRSLNSLLYIVDKYININEQNLNFSKQRMIFFVQSQLKDIYFMIRMIYQNNT